MLFFGITLKVVDRFAKICKILKVATKYTPFLSTAHVKEAKRKIIIGTNSNRLSVYDFIRNCTRLVLLVAFLSTSLPELNGFSSTLYVR